MDAYEQAMYGAMPSYQLTEEEKKALRMQQMIATGAALMAGRGNFVNNLGQAMLVGQNQGSEGMQELRRNKLADAEIQYRNAQIQNQQRTYEAAQAKALADQQAAQERASRLGNVQSVLQRAREGRVDPAAFSVAPNVPVSPEDARRAAYEQALHMSVGDKDMATIIQNAAKEFLPNYGVGVNVGVNNGNPYNYLVNNFGQTKRLEEAPPPAFDWKDAGGTLEARNKYDPQSILATIRKSVSPDTGARVAQDDRDLAERRRQFNQTQFEVPGTALYPGYGPGNVMAPREKLPQVFAAKGKPEKAAETDKPVTRSQWMDDTRADWMAKYPSQYGERPKGAPTLDEYRQQYPFEGKKGDAAVTAPAAKSDADEVAKKAKEAIASGKSREAVLKRLRDNGYDPDKMGL